jgi:glycogen debranching enzyme
VLPLKTDYCYAILDDRGMVEPGIIRANGFYRHDTRHLSRYVWNFGDLQLIHSQATSSTLTQHWSRMRRHAQEVLLERRLTLTATGIEERFHIESWSDAPLTLDIRLEADADFIDIFQARGHRRQAPANPVRRSGADLSYLAQDGVESTTRIEAEASFGSASLTVAPRETIERRVAIHFDTTLPAAQIAAVAGWWPQNDRAGLNEAAIRTLDQAIADISSLLLTTEQGPMLAAGIPNFVVPFGRDSLITSWLLLDKSVLNFLAAHQGSKLDPFRDEEPGKILHEHRESELSRLGELPFRTYYGSADSTSLFVILLADYVARTGDTGLARALEPNWRAALTWIEHYSDDRGLINFRQRKDGKGLTVQSWKDSADSMSYADGTAGQGGLAVAEVQGYVFAAFQSAAQLSAHCGGPETEQTSWRHSAKILAETFDRLYWMPRHENYALALDEAGRQLDVNASDSGHLLWSGIVPEAKATRVIARLFAPDMWSGYGLRTLSTKERRYNPLSYHNGSVWPHDTAIFAAGLKRYGDLEGFAKVREALVALASASDDLRLPELVGGYAREGNIPPLPYTESCRPQAWSAAALIYALGR